MQNHPSHDRSPDAGLAQIKRDLLACFARFPVESLLHLRENFHRLIRGAYQRNGGGCIFHLLSEALPQKIGSRQALIRYFTGRAADDCDAPGYLPAKHIVKIWDGDLDHPHTAQRYPGVRKLGQRFLRVVLLEAIELRLAAGAKVQRRIAKPHSRCPARLLALLGL